MLLTDTPGNPRATDQLFMQRALQNLDTIPLPALREYIKQREEKEFFSCLTAMEANDLHVRLDMRDASEHASRRITLFIDPDYMEAIPENQRMEALEKLWATGRIILAERGIALHEGHMDRMTRRKKEPGSEKDQKWQIRFDIDFYGSLPPDIHNAAQQKQHDTEARWFELTEEKRAAEVKAALAELDDPQLTRLVNKNAPEHHASLIGEAYRDQIIHNAARPRVAEAERFLQQRMNQARSSGLRRR